MKQEKNLALRQCSSSTNYAFMAKSHQPLRPSLSLLQISRLLVIIFCPNTLTISIPPNGYWRACSFSVCLSLAQCIFTWPYDMNTSHVTHHALLFSHSAWWWWWFQSSTGMKGLSLALSAHSWRLKVQQHHNHLHRLFMVLVLGVLLFDFFLCFLARYFIWHALLRAYIQWSSVYTLLTFHDCCTFS